MMTSEAHRVVSVKARAREIEARASGKGTPGEQQWRTKQKPAVLDLGSSSNKVRRSSEGDIFLRCPPRTQLAGPSGSDVTHSAFSPTIFSLPPHSPLDDILSALEKICDEFTTDRPDPEGDPSGDKLYSSTLQFTPLTCHQPDATSKQSDGTPEQSNGTSEQSGVIYKQSNVTSKQSNVTSKQSNVTSKQSNVTSKQSNVTSKQPNVKCELLCEQPKAAIEERNASRRVSSPSEELEIVKNILANLDFDKYKRRMSLDTDRKSSAPESKSPQHSGKLKDLFENLQQSPRASKTPFGLCRSLSFSNAEENTFSEDGLHSQKLSGPSNKLSTLPRRKEAVGQSIKGPSSCPSLVDHLKAEGRKRRKGTTECGRSLTYPPQKKVENLTEGVDPPPPPVVESLSVDGKPQKKKHHSDPGSSSEAPFLTDSKAQSEPELEPLKLVIEAHHSPSRSLTSGATPNSVSGVSRSPQEQRRYSKRRLRGPYGEMLEEEMRKSGEKHKTAIQSDLSFLQESRQDAPRTAMFLSSQSLDDATTTDLCVTPKRKVSANFPMEEPKTPSKPKPTASSQEQNLDTRTHVVYEIFETERSYVDSLQTLVTKYMGALKSTDYNGVVEGGIVDEIFFQVPEILNIHDDFLDALSHRCSNWDAKFTIGDLFIEAFTKQQVIDTYTAFINNWKCAKDATKIATQAKPAFARFLEYMSREHKGKLALDALLIMPVQRIPRYELLIKELLKHTPMDHPDHQLLVQAQKEVHDLAVKINRVEREAFQIEQMQSRVREIEHHIDGVVDLCIPDRAFIRHDVVTIPGGLGTKKERCLFLFSDVLLITSIKRKSTAMRKPSSTPAPSTSQSPFSVLDSNKYKLLTRFSLESMEISKNTDVSLKKAMRDIATLEEDIHILSQIKDLVDKISSPHQTLEDIVRDLTNSVSKQMLEKQNNDYSLISLEMTVTTQERIENLTIQFTSPERRAVWSAAFNEAKQKLAISTGRRPPPELRKAMPIRKTRAGLQFTCATATLGYNQQGLREVWVCNSDGYVGQVCVLSLLPEPTVMSCNGVCNARILTIASIPATCTMIADRNRWRPPVPDKAAGISIEIEDVEECSDSLANNGNIQLDSDSSDDDDTESADEDRGESRRRGNSIPREDGQEDTDIKQPTMWLGTEDGCVHVYNCSDNIRTKKNKIKIQHNAAIQCIIYLDNRVFVSIANGEVHIYKKETDGGWSACEPQKVIIGSSSSPVTIMLAVAGKLWCGCQNSIHVLNTTTLQVEHSFAVSSDTSRYVLCMVTSGLGVWVTVTPSAVIRLFHATNYEPLLDVNVAPTVAKILSAATDDIIKQHKSACLRVTAMLACKDLLWIGTSAGVILTLPLPHLTSSTLIVDNIPPITGLPHGHTGHVRFLTSVETSSCSTLDTIGYSKYSFRSNKNKESASGRRTSTTASAGTKLLVISGGDGYEDFETSGLGEQAGHDDSTNHLLLWHV